MNYKQCSTEFAVIEAPPRNCHCFSSIRHVGTGRASHAITKYLKFHTKSYHIFYELHYAHACVKNLSQRRVYRYPLIVTSIHAQCSYYAQYTNGPGDSRTHVRSCYWALRYVGVHIVVTCFSERTCTKRFESENCQMLWTNIAELYNFKSCMLDHSITIKD